MKVNKKELGIREGEREEGKQCEKGGREKKNEGKGEIVFQGRIQVIIKEEGDNLLMVLANSIFSICKISCSVFPFRNLHLHHHRNHRRCQSSNS